MRVIGVIFMILGVIFALLGIGISELRGLIILGLFIVFCGYMSIRTSKARKVAKQRIKKMCEEEGIKVMANGVHMAGLPIGEGAVCAIFAKEDQITFVKDGKEYNLDVGKITDITQKTDTEIQQAYVSSAGGAVGGALVFGPLGAMIGGRTVKETTKTIHKYLIFTYKKNDGVDYISFDVTTDHFRAAQLADFVRARISTPDSIDL